MQFKNIKTVFDIVGLKSRSMSNLFVRITIETNAV